jgi:hypothetical protein
MFNHWCSFSIIMVVMVLFLFGAAACTPLGGGAALFGALSIPK